MAETNLGIKERNLAEMAEFSRELIQYLIDLSISGLEKMYDHQAHYFSYRAKRTLQGIKNEGVSRRYTIISLLGLHEYENHGGVVRIDIKNSISTLIKDIDQVENIGDLGLLLWLLALAAPGEIESVLSNDMMDVCLKKYPDSRAGKTTEMAWFLAGISHVSLSGVKGKKSLENLARQAYSLIKQNYGGKGIFAHVKLNSITGMMRGRVGCFADQVYPIYAFSKFGQAYGHREAVKIAEECASKICDLQGDLGQWWWHYDVRTGKVAGRYPVYSVHQDGMAPMALFAVQEACGKNFDREIYKGLAWIFGQNELGINLVNEPNHMIWRNIHTGKIRKYADLFGTFIGNAAESFPDKDELRTLYECRPYHLGWLLYAFCGK